MVLSNQPEEQDRQDDQAQEQGDEEDQLSLYLVHPSQQQSPDERRQDGIHDDPEELPNDEDL